MHEGHFLSGKTRGMLVGGWMAVCMGVNMEVMSGWAKQPLPQSIALLRIMTHPQPIGARRHLHLHILIFDAEYMEFAAHRHTHNVHALEQVHNVYPQSNMHVNESNGCKNMQNHEGSCISSTSFMCFIWQRSKRPENCSKFLLGD